MKPVIEKVFSQIDFSFSTEYVEVNNFSSKWHYHDKVEIILIIDTSGTGYVGESIVPFSGDTLSLIGSGVPHAWLNDHRYSKKNSSLLAKAIVLKFEDDFLGEKFLALPGMKSIVDLLKIHSKRGMFIEGNDKGEIKNFLINIMETSNDFERVILLVKILRIIAESNSITYLSAKKYEVPSKSSDNERLDKVFHYVVENYHQKIELKTIADLASLSPSGFCKYFKKRTLKTFSRFLNEYRIGHACRMIIDGHHSMSEVCYLTGFNQMSNFYKQFHAVHKISPLKYRERFYESENNPEIQSMQSHSTAS